MSAVAYADQMNYQLRIQALQAALDQANVQIIEQLEVMQLALDALEKSPCTAKYEQDCDVCNAIDFLRGVLGESK